MLHYNVFRKQNPHPGLTLMKTSLRICDWTTSRTKGSLIWNYPRRATQTASETLSAELDRETLTLDQMQTDE